MSRIVLVSNRVVDLRKAPQAGGVAVALADVVRSRNALWFGWNGEIKADGERRRWSSARAASPPSRCPTAEHRGYYLGYANSVLWPVFHNRLDLAQFEAGFFDRYVDVNRRLAGAAAADAARRRRHLGARLSPDPASPPSCRTPRRRRTRSASICTFRFRPGRRSWPSPSIRSSRARSPPTTSIGLQTKADVANLIDYMANGVIGRIVPDGRIRLFDRLVSVASFPVGIDVADFAKAKRDAGLVQAPRRRSAASSASTVSTTPRACRRSSRPSAASSRSIRSTSARWC